MKGNALAQGEIIAKEKNTLKFLRNLLLQNQQANFNQTYCKSFLGRGNSKFFK
jgi:hypothetical protein